jgi:hypothetical protein
MALSTDACSPSAADEDGSKAVWLPTRPWLQGSGRRGESDSMGVIENKKGEYGCGAGRASPSANGVARRARDGADVGDQSGRKVCTVNI